MDTSHFSDSQIKFMGALFNALYAYVSRRYAGRVLLFKAKTEPLYHLLEVDKRWSEIAQNLEVISVRGTHVTIVREPYVLAVAEHLKVALARFHQVTVQPAEVEEVVA